MPMDFIQNIGGEQQFDREFRLYLNKSQTGYWYFNLSGRPKYEVLYFYLLFGGHVRYRANILDFLPSGEMRVLDGVMFAKSWVRVTAPVVKFTYPYPRKGFQGFRYTSKELLEELW